MDFGSSGFAWAGVNDLSGPAIVAVGVLLVYLTLAWKHFMK